MASNSSLALLAGLALLAFSRRRGDGSVATSTSPAPPTEPLDPVTGLDGAQLQALASHERGESQPLDVPSATHTPATIVEPSPVEPSPVEPSPPRTDTGALGFDPSTIVDGRWTLSPSGAALADAIARSGDIVNRQGTPLPSDDLSRAQLPLAPGLDALVGYLRRETGLSVGAARGPSVQAPARRADGTLRNRDVHEEGRAADVMTRNARKGTIVADWLLRNARVLGVQQLIWSRSYWTSSVPRRGRHSFGAYTGRSPHTDHVHFELSPQWAFDVARIRSALEQIAPPAR